MKKVDIVYAKRHLAGMVKVTLFGGGVMFVNISDIHIQSNRRVKVGCQRYYQSAIWRIQKENDRFAPKPKRWPNGDKIKKGES